jgi:hypothetical protein
MNQANAASLSTRAHHQNPPTIHHPTKEGHFAKAVGGQNTTSGKMARDPARTSIENEVNEGDDVSVGTEEIPENAKFCKVSGGEGWAIQESNL